MDENLEEMLNEVEESIEIEQEEFKPITYKIMSGNEYMVFRNEYAGNVFYKIQVTKKNYDETKLTGYKTVKFKKGVDLPDKTKIKILGGFEDFYFKPNDRFNPIFTLFITDFIVTENSVDTTKKALEEYNTDYTENYDLPF